MKKTSLLLVFLLSAALFACQPGELPEAELATVSPITASETSSVRATSGATPNAIPTADSALNAILQEIEGSVEAKDVVETGFSSAENGRTIAENGQVRTLENGFTRVDLSSGTLIRMAPLSYFTLVENQPADEGLLTRIKLELGQIWIVLNGGSLEVETPSGQASVRGSYMMVEIDPETQSALVTCLEGNCSIETPAGKVELVNGQRARLQPPALTGGIYQLPLIEKMSERDFAGWLFFAPEAKNIFPLLEKEQILPWDDWQSYLPEDDATWLDLLDGLPDEPLLDGNLLPDDGSLLPDGDGTLLDGDGSLLDRDGTLPRDDGSNLPGGGINLPGDGVIRP